MSPPVGQFRQPMASDFWPSRSICGQPPDSDITRHSLCWCGWWESFSRAFKTLRRSFAQEVSIYPAVQKVVQMADPAPPTRIISSGQQSDEKKREVILSWEMDNRPPYCERVTLRTPRMTFLFCRGHWPEISGPWKKFYFQPMKVVGIWGNRKPTRAQFCCLLWQWHCRFTTSVLRTNIHTPGKCQQLWLLWCLCTCASTSKSTLTCM